MDMAASLRPGVDMAASLSPGVDMAASPSPGVDRWRQAESTGYEAGRDLRTGPSPSGSPRGASQHSRETGPLRLLLLGKRGSGKSATGNSILGRAVFQSRFSDQMVTTWCQRESGVVSGREVTVIDTPDLFSSPSSAELRRLHLQQCLELSAPRLHALLLLVPIGHYTAEDQETVEGIRAEFGAEAMRHVVVVFSREDELGEDSLQDYIESKASLGTLLGEVGGHCAFSNKLDEGQRGPRVGQLLGLIQRLVEKSSRPYLVNCMTEGSRLQCCENETTHRGGKSPCEPLNIILVGRSGTGKSATGNTILGRPVFVSQLRAQPVTETFQRGTRRVDGQDVVVVDTPSFHHMLCAQRNPPRIREEVSRYCAEGTKIFVLVLQLGRITEEDKTAVKQLKVIFGKVVMKYVIVLFTRKEDLGDENFEDYINDTDNKTLKKILKKCKRRACAFNNKETGLAQVKQVKDLLTIANELREHRDGHGYDFERDQKSNRNINGLKKLKCFPRNFKMQ